MIYVFKKNNEKANILENNKKTINIYIFRKNTNFKIF